MDGAYAQSCAMKSFAVICADPTDLNPGMLSVDLALACLMRELPGDNELVYFNPKQARSMEGSEGSLRYRLLSDTAELERFDAVIYWGDFVHWLRYAHWDWQHGNPKLAEGRTPAQLLDQWYRLYLLETRTQDFQDQIVVFGGTVYGMTAQDFSNPRYLSALSALYGSACLVAPRDFVSAHLIQHLTPGQRFSMGCDCAFFLDADAVLPMLAAAQIAAPQIPERFVVCSFGRSGANAALTQFANELAAKLQARLVVMNWLGHPEGLDGLAFKLAVLRKATVLVTDTYHCAVSGWREGIPVIGIGQALSRGTGTLDDKKKEIFFRQILASDYYLYVEEIVPALSDAVALQTLLQRSVEALSNTAALAAIGGFIRIQISAAKARLLAALQSTPA